MHAAALDEVVLWDLCLLDPIIQVEYPGGGRGHNIAFAGLPGIILNNLGNYSCSTTTAIEFDFWL